MGLRRRLAIIGSISLAIGCVTALTAARSGDQPLTLADHGDLVYCVAFSPDGKRMVSSSRGGQGTSRPINSLGVLRVTPGRSSAWRSVPMARALPARACWTTQPGIAPFEYGT